MKNLLECWYEKKEASAQNSISILDNFRVDWIGLNLMLQSIQSNVDSIRFVRHLSSTYNIIDEKRKQIGCQQIWNTNLTWEEPALKYFTLIPNILFNPVQDYT